MRSGARDETPPFPRCTSRWRRRRRRRRPFEIAIGVCIFFQIYFGENGEKVLSANRPQEQGNDEIGCTQSYLQANYIYLARSREVAAQEAVLKTHLKNG